MTGLVANAQATLARALWLLTRVRGLPLAGEALGFAEIVRSHPVCNYVAIGNSVLSPFTGTS